MRRSLRISLLVMLVLVAGSLTTLYFLIRHEPEWFRASAVPPGPERQRDSIEFESKAIALHQQITQENLEEWTLTATERQVNSWLAEDFYAHKFDRQFGTPEQVRELRVGFRQGKLLLACRWGSETWNTVISLEAKVWLSPSEPNVVAVEFLSLRAGALPFSIKSFQDRITELCRNQNVDVQWYHNEGNAVALLRFQPHRREPTFQLQELTLRDGELTIRGRSLDPDHRRKSRPD